MFYSLRDFVPRGQYLRIMPAGENLPTLRQLFFQLAKKSFDILPITIYINSAEKHSQSFTADYNVCDLTAEER